MVFQLSLISPLTTNIFFLFLALTVKNTTLSLDLPAECRIQAFQSDFCVINFVQLLILLFAIYCQALTKFKKVRNGWITAIAELMPTKGPFVLRRAHLNHCDRDKGDR